MKILHVTNHFHPCIGGIENFVKNLCVNLQKQGIESEVLCLSKCHNSGKQLLKTETIDGVHVERIGFLDFKYYKLSFFPLAFLKKFDIIHVHNLGFFSDYLLLTKFFHKKPVVLSTHGGIWHTEKMLQLKKIYFGLVQSFVLKSADFLIADSRSDYGIFSGKSKNIMLIENGIDYAKFSGIKRKNFTVNFLFLGRLSKNKNLSRLIESFEVVCSAKPRAKLFIAGKNFDEDLQNLVHSVKQKHLEQNVFFTGELSESGLKKIVSECSFCVYSSSFEGFGISILELMSSGIIPILNDISTFNRFVKDGQNGFITDFSDKNASSIKILAALQLDTAAKIKLSQAAKMSAEEFSWNKKIFDYVDLYNKILGK